MAAPLRQMYRQEQMQQIDLLLHISTSSKADFELLYLEPFQFAQTSKASVHILQIGF